MLLLTTNKKPRYIIHGVPKDTLIILHTPQGLYTLVPRATLRGVAELHVASGMPQWRMFVTSCYI